MRPARLHALRALAALALLCAMPGSARAVPSPAIIGPVTGGNGSPFVASTSFDLAEVGYEQAEYFIDGTATAFTNTSPLESDGRFAAAPASTAHYRTRLIVYRPTDPRRFNGSVVVEWLNVSGGLDAAPDWTFMHDALIRGGFAWVGVSAQKVGVEGGTAIVGIVDLPLKRVDPVRYGSLSHPGDSFSYDMFSQAGEALRHPNGPDPLGGLRAKRFIAVGESQSAFRMVTYVDAVHPLAHVYDGFLIHSRGAGSALLSEAPQPVVATPRPTLIRTDIDVPVLMFQSETDMALLGYVSDVQPDSEHVRLWEVAGTSHADAYSLKVGFDDTGSSPSGAMLILTSSTVAGSCSGFINGGPEHFVLNAAMVALDRWVRRGTAPRPAPRFQVFADGTLARDGDGNVIGGIRTPPLDAPIATLSGEGWPGSLICALAGKTIPFTTQRLRERYPTHADYVQAFNRSAKRAVRQGWLLPVDARLMRSVAVASDIPG